MSIAVVVPLYNGEKWVGEALDSVFAQELLPEEIIVVDDGSTDGSARIVRGYADVTLLRNDGDGSSNARNRGTRVASADLIAFLDQDDLWHPSHLRLLADALGAQPEAGAAISDAATFQTGVPDYEPQPAGIDLVDPWRRYPFTIGVDGPSLCLVRRDALDTIGHWEECATGMGDALLFLKLAAINPLARVRAKTVGKRIHDSQQWLQVRELGTAYLEFRYEVMERALAFRSHYSPDDPNLGLHAGRLESLRVLRDLTGTMLSQDWTALPEQALKLEEQVVGEDEEYVRQAFYCLMGALFKTHDAAELRALRDQTFGRALPVWPEEAVATRACLRDLIGEMPRVS